MNRIDRGWLFRHPDFEGPEPGLCLSSRGAMAMVEGDDCVRQAILLLLTTAPGERVMRPEYGCDLRRLVFWRNDATTHGLAVHYVRQALQRWEPRIEVIRIDAGPHPHDAARLEIYLTYRVRREQTLQSLSLSVNLMAADEQ